MSPRPELRSPTMRTLMRHGWIPAMHGAWAMALMPPILGMKSGGVTALTPIVCTAWLFGFFAFDSLGLWVKARTGRRIHIRPALLTWSTLAGVCALISLIFQPALSAWAVVLGPLAALALWETLHKRAHSILARASAIIAACAMCPLIASISKNLAYPWELTLKGAYLYAFILAAYFLGSLLCVRSVVRGRTKIHWVFLSALWHITCTGALIILPHGDFTSHAFAVVWAMIALRGIGVPIWGHLSQNVSIKIVAACEMFLSLALFTVLWVNIG